LRILKKFYFHPQDKYNILRQPTQSLSFVRFVHMATLVRKAFKTDVKHMQRRRHHMTARGL